MYLKGAGIKSLTLSHYWQPASGAAFSPRLSIHRLHPQRSLTAGRSKISSISWRMYVMQHA